MNEALKKIKHLRITFLQYAQETSIPGAWTEELEEDLVSNLFYRLFNSDTGQEDKCSNIS